MAVTAAQLRERVKTTTSTTSDEVLQGILDEAEELLLGYIDVTDEVDDAAELGIPEVTMDQAHMATAVELWNIRRAPNGVLTQQVATDDGGQTIPIRISADPMRPVRPMLARWIGGLTT